MDKKRRVVVTGLGTLAPNGLSTEAYWNALLNGESGIDYIERFEEAFSQHLHVRHAIATSCRVSTL